MTPARTSASIRASSRALGSGSRRKIGSEGKAVAAAKRLVSAAIPLLSTVSGTGSVKSNFHRASSNSTARVAGWTNAAA